MYVCVCVFLSVIDVFVYSAPAYQTYVLQTDDGVKEYKTKTYMIGNLNNNAHNSNSSDKNSKNKKGKTKKKGKYILHTDDNEYSLDVTENSNDSDSDYDDEYDDDSVVVVDVDSNALGGGAKRKRKKTPDSMTNLIGNDSNDIIDMTPIDIENIHNAESANDSDPQIIH